MKKMSTREALAVADWASLVNPRPAELLEHWRNENGITRKDMRRCASELQRWLRRLGFRIVPVSRRKGARP